MTNTQYLAQIAENTRAYGIHVITGGGAGTWLKHSDGRFVMGPRAVCEAYLSGLHPESRRTARVAPFGEKAVAQPRKPRLKSILSKDESLTPCSIANSNSLAFVTDGPCSKEAGHNGSCDWQPK